MAVAEIERMVLETLDRLGIPYVRHEHPPVATVEEAEKHWATLKGTHCKNLFLRNYNTDTRRFFDPLVQLLASAVSERFMDERHHAMWQLVSEPEQVPAAIAAAPELTSDAQRLAVP